VCCACLKLERKHVVSCLLKCDVRHHVHATLVRGQLVEQVSLSVEHPDTVRAVNLVPGKNVEVTVQICYVNQAVLYPLCTVNQHRYTVAVSFSYNLLYRIDGSEYIGDMRDG